MDFRIETERLIMRPLEISDAAAFFAMDKNPNVHTYLWKKPVQEIGEAIKKIEMVQKQYDTNQIGRFATILKETGEFIGWTGIKFVNDNVENGNTNFYDYGYRLDEKFWNKGFASEATIAWLNYGFNQMNIDKMHASTHSENGASNHILQKVGFSMIEEYLDKDEILWKWWELEQKSFK